tara:strand:- start:2546 stop:4834 length:2289 start_codon:yes stop_codon:yes gene_type:complete
MKNFKKNFFLTLFTLSFYSFGQSIDSSILSQITPEQIEIAKNAVENKPLLLNEDNSDLPVTQESLVTQESDSNDLGVNDDLSITKYGYDFFSSMPTSLTAVGDLPLPNEYKISLKDQFSIILSGSKDEIFNLNVKLDGTILFPELGSILVAGLTFREVKNKLSTMIEKAYVGVNIDVSLQNLSAKKITIVGAVNTPGTYLVNPFSTISGALAYSGGISEIGSLRDIRLVRNTGETFSFDLYDLLINGDRSSDVTIEAGDTILIGAASQFVEINGAVNRPAIYEILSNETLNDAIKFALGFKNIANTTNISVAFLDLEKAAITKKTINNLDQDLKNALSIEVFSYVSDANANVQVIGAVEEPGFYDLNKYSTLDDLISDLKFINVYPWLGILEQFDSENLIQSSILFSLNDKSSYQSIKLLPNSKLHFANILDRSFDVSEIGQSLIDDFSLTLNHKQGTFILPVYGQFNVSSFVDLLGLDMSDVEKEVTYISPLDSTILTQDYRSMTLEARKYNNITFRSPVNDLIYVDISGAIDFPGVYTLRANSTLEDLYMLVGRFKSEAFLDGIILQRNSLKERQLKAIERSEIALNESLLLSAESGQSIQDIVMLNELASSIDPENLGRIAGDFSPSSDAANRTILLDGDTVIIPKKSNIINVFGEVLNPIAFEYSSNMSIQSAVALAGGFKNSADKKRIYVISANGTVSKAKRNIFMGNRGLMPGDTIVVPRKINTNTILTRSLVPVTQVLSDLAFSAAAIDSLSNSN